MAGAPAERVAALAGRPVTGMRRLAGGDLSSVALVRFADGTEAVAKWGAAVAEEAAMLETIRATGCPVPASLASDGDLLLMARLPEGGRPDWESCGAAIARLHAARGPTYGWPRDHAFGPVPIPGGNDAGDWPAFWAEHRLLAAPRSLPATLARRLERLAAGLCDRLPKAPPAALLHGDLWSGNLLFGPEGLAGVIDPACSHGDPEVDLAMLHLFGRPGPAFAEAYGALPPGWQARRPIYQLWPALVHLRLFGPGYRGLVEGLLAEAGA